eukprot:scaffold64377_cov38-Phaeocystis_antarctica.AAC.1
MGSLLRRWGGCGGEVGTAITARKPRLGWGNGVEGPWQAASPPLAHPWTTRPEPRHGSGEPGNQLRLRQSNSGTTLQIPQCNSLKINVVVVHFSRGVNRNWPRLLRVIVVVCGVAVTSVAYSLVVIWVA